MNDELLVRRMVERWAVWRDAGDWERFATVWHPEGVMMATWFQGPFRDFIRLLLLAAAPNDFSSPFPQAETIP